MIEYRKATIDDLQELVRLRLEFLAQINPDPVPAGLKESLERCYRRQLQNGELIAWLGIQGCKIVATGMVSFYQLLPNYTCPSGRIGYISGIYTLADVRRQGIARAIMEKLLDEARAAGCDKVGLSATQMGKPLYSQLGFNPTQHEMTIYLNQD